MTKDSVAKILRDAHASAAELLREAHAGYEKLFAAGVAELRASGAPDYIVDEAIKQLRVEIEEAMSRLAKRTANLPALVARGGRGDDLTVQ